MNPNRGLEVMLLVLCILLALGFILALQPWRGL